MSIMLNFNGSSKVTRSCYGIAQQYIKRRGLNGNMIKELQTGKRLCNECDAVTFMYILCYARANSSLHTVY